MAKYIDAEKLTKAIEEKGLDCSFALKMERLDTLALIDSLQQEQAEKDLALTLEDIVRLDCLIMGMEAEGYNEGYKTRPFYEEVLRRFNEAKK